MLLMTDIHVRSFTGSHLKPYAHSVAKLRSEVLKEYPYYKEVDLAHELEEIKRVTSCKDAIGVLISDSSILVGASLGYPLSLCEPALCAPFIEQGIDLATFFYFSEPVLLKPYRGRGMKHHFFDTAETYVLQHKKFTHTCFITPLHAEGESQQPDDFFPLYDFWRKRGYVQASEMQCHLSWKEVHKAAAIDHTMTVWIKELPERC